MDEVRLIDGNALEQEMREFAAQIFVGCHRTTTDSEEVVHTCADMVNEAPTIDPESLPPYWRKTAEDPPTREAIELKFSTNVTKNPFSATFGSLDGLTVTGVWNAEQARVEF